MKRKILLIIVGCLIIIFIKLLFNLIVNSILITKYNNSNFEKREAQLLTVLNFPEGYVSHYNYGNILYQNQEYEDAIEQYKKSLNYFVPKYKECNIRINYALAICKTVQINEKEKTSREDAIQKYESAIDVLVEDGCANRNESNGHSEKAETLKNDILKEIERLKNMKNESQNTEDKDNDKKEEKANSTEDEIQTIEEKIQQIKEDATQEQRDVESELRNYEKLNEAFSRNGQKIW